ncbi:MAG: hypothetical protein VKL39_19310 [Leptolyngbyaceae bacterium]|nr:hypothetical protein [Leptolyngbyaceae bacterium]
MAIDEILQSADLSQDDYVVLGMATCFIREDAEVHPVQVIEPIPSAALEAILKGVATSYEFAHATTLGSLFEGETVTLPSVFPGQTQLCDDFNERLSATARTYRSHDSSTHHIPVGTTYREFNYSVERKRLLNSERIVKTEDNVKQHEYTHKTL